MTSPHFLLQLAALVGLGLPPSDRADEPVAEFKVHPIGHVRRAENHTLIVLEKKCEPGLLGLDGYSHIYVFWWFDRNDTPEKRAVLQVHPMGNRDNPLSGVFATRSPVRPNLVALTLCKIVAVKENVIEVENIDAFDGTAVIDIKPFIPSYDTADDAKTPTWLERTRKRRQEDIDKLSSSEHAGVATPQPSPSAQQSGAPRDIASEQSLPDRYPYVVEDILNYCQPKEGFWIDLGAGKG